MFSWFLDKQQRFNINYRDILQGHEFPKSDGHPRCSCISSVAGGAGAGLFQALKPLQKLLSVLWLASSHFPTVTLDVVSLASASSYSHAPILGTGLSASSI